MTVALFVIAALELAALIALGVVTLVMRRKLTSARRALRDRPTRSPEIRPRRRPRGVAPLAVKTVVDTVQTADSLIRKGLGGSIRHSIDDLAGWARVERPDLARITADGSVVLLFSDIEDSTRHNQTLGDRDWITILERHNKLVEHSVSAHGGYVVKNQGDGFMIAFADPADALQCSLDVQRALCGGTERWNGIRVRIGAHAGTSVRRGHDLFGLDVVMAARIADLARGGEILVSAALRDSVADADGFSFTAGREVRLKGITDAQTVHALEMPAS